MRVRPIPLYKKAHTKVVVSKCNCTVYYHQTPVVTIKREDGIVILDSEGHQTATTKRRMNHASEEFGLGFMVYQRNWEWFVSYKGEELPFFDLMHLYKEEPT